MGAPPSRSVFSTSTAFCPMLASACAAAKPAGPPPTMRMGFDIGADPSGAYVRAARAASPPAGRGGGLASVLLLCHTAVMHTAVVRARIEPPPTHPPASQD